MVYDLPPAEREGGPKIIEFTGRIPLPFRIPAGTKCQLTMVQLWRPAFSLQDHVIPEPDLEFVVVPASPERRKAFDPQETPLE